MTDQTPESPQSEAPGPRVLLTVEQAAAALGISRTTMFALIKTGELETVLVGRLRRVPADEIDAYIAKLSGDPERPRRGRPPKASAMPAVDSETVNGPEVAPEDHGTILEEQQKPKKKRVPRSKRIEGTRAPNGAGSVYLGKDGLWHVRVTVGVKDDGTPDRRHRTAKTEPEAYDKLHELTAEAKAGAARKAGRTMTVAEWLTHWVENIAPITARFKTLSGHRTAVYRYLIPNLGANRIDRVTADHFERLYAKILATGVGPHTPNSVHRSARAAFNEAVRRDVLRRNVVLLAKPPRIVEEEVEPFEADDAQRIMVATLKRRNGVRFVLALALGIRQGEALGIRWDRLDEKTRQIRFPKQLQRQSWQHGCADPHACGGTRHKTEPCPTPCQRHKQTEFCRPCPASCKGHARHCPKRHSGGIVEVEVKSRAGKRRITLPDWLWEMIQAHRAAQDAERLHAGTAWQDGPWMFTQEDGRPIDSKADREEWNEVLAEAGVRPARLHDARHTAGTFLGLLGVTPRAMMEMMGWSSPEMLLRYVHVTDEMRADTTRRIGEHLRPEAKGEPDDAEDTDGE